MRRVRTVGNIFLLQLIVTAAMDSTFGGLIGGLLKKINRKLIVTLMFLFVSPV